MPGSPFYGQELATASQGESRGQTMGLNMTEPPTQLLIHGYCQELITSPQGESRGQTMGLNITEPLAKRATHGLLPCVGKPHPNGKLDSGRTEYLGQERQVDRIQLPASVQIAVFTNAV